MHDKLGDIGNVSVEMCDISLVNLVKLSRLVIGLVMNDMADFSSLFMSLVSPDDLHILLIY